MNYIYVGVEPLDFANEYQRLSQSSKEGAIVTFTGKVRDYNAQGNIDAVVLEHYPGMTEKQLQHIVDKAALRWQLGNISIIHRVGKIFVNEDIVFVGVSSGHRADAFQAAEFIMDYLKNDAPFWKRECSSNGDNWVDAKSSDHQALLRWQK